MIDFINPRSKKTILSLSLAVLSIVVMGAGAWTVYQKTHEYKQAKALAEVSTLPSGDVVIEGLTIEELLELSHQVEENVNEDTQTETENIKNTEVVSDTIVNKTSVIETEQASEESKSESVSAPEQNNPIPTVNTLVIPQMGVNGRIYEGNSEATLSKGLWHMPMTSDDPSSGNMVITAHRYLRRPPNPNTFYLLDKLQVGDDFHLYWEGEKYNYKVKDIKIVEPDFIDILYNTPTAQLTLFSCTPLFTSDKRLVVTADLISIE